MDERNNPALSFSPDDRFEVSPDQSLTELDKEELQIFQIAWKERTLKGIWKHSPFGDDETEDIIRRLIQKGYLVKV